MRVERLNVAGRVASNGECKIAGVVIDDPDQEVLNDIADGVAIPEGLAIVEDEFIGSDVPDDAVDVEREFAVVDLSDDTRNDVADAVRVERLDVAGRVAPDGKIETAGVVVHL